MYDDPDMYGGMDGNDLQEPPPTKTVWQSVLAIVLALALGAVAVSLFLIHYIASEVGYLIWAALTMGPAFAAAYYLDKDLVGYHIWSRLAVGVIIFFSVAIVIAAALDAHHF
jgi:hypothetical protein